MRCNSSVNKLSPSISLLRPKGAGVNPPAYNPRRPLFHPSPKLAVHLLIGALVLAVTGTAGWFAYDNLPVGVTLNLKDGQTEVPLDQKLALTFTRPAGRDAVTSAFHVAPAVQGRLERSSDGRLFTFEPERPWADLTVYSVRLDPFDQAGHGFPARTWSFRTTVVPRVLAVTAGGGPLPASRPDVKLGTPLKLLFSSPMDQSTVKLTANARAAALSWQAGGTAAVLDTSAIPAGPLQLALLPGAQDLQKRPLPAAWSFAVNMVFRVDIKTTQLRSPALVQVPNDAGARDQTGLSAADLVFEYLTEGGVTRLTAIFTRVPDIVGPVRSGRLISFGLTRHYHGQLFLSGLSDGSMARLRADPVPTVFDGYGAGYYRAATHAAPDNLYLKGSSIAADLTSGDSGQLVKGATSLEGDAAASVSVPEHSTTYAYDPLTATYTKVEEGHRYNDLAIGQPLRIQMVVVMHTTAAQTGYVEDVNGLKGLDFNLDSGGRAEIYYQGKRATGTWSAAGRTSGLAFKTDAGAPVVLPDGLVWVDVVAR